ncbi:hypothetical protein [Dankookia sp. P2]|uniref:hypothetical protein n=1 Tax=Dankookia sp. P2 TaxID=3423955 RepID=UPI003D67DFEC
MLGTTPARRWRSWRCRRGVHGAAGAPDGGLRRAPLRAPLFAIPEGFDPVAAIAVGEPGPPEALPEVLAQRETAPRQRRPIEEFAFLGGWKG